jgi:hypothetical protein
MNLTCPYCQHNFEYRPDGEEQGERYEEECPSCSKIFAYEIEIEIVTTTYKADCLNGGEHEWTTIPCYPDFMTQRYCPCGKSEFVHEETWRKEMAKKYIKQLEVKE